MPRHIACLTFDFDVWSGWTARGLSTPTPVSRGMPISWTLDDYPRFQFLRAQNFVLPGLMNVEDVLRNWLDDFLHMTRDTDWGVLPYTCHPYVIGRGHRMLMFERLIEGLKGMNAVFLTMEKAADEFLARGNRHAGPR